MCERKWKEVYQFRGQNVDNFENNNRERLKCKVQKRLGCDKEKLKKRKFEEKFDLKKKIGFSRSEREFLIKKMQ